VDVIEAIGFRNEILGHRGPTADTTRTYWGTSEEAVVQLVFAGVDVELVAFDEDWSEVV
jgi:hypothetical protein